jgi:NAD(P)-dependent dehydrogenase (short-subunit alcohol dehydrogenase family)
MQSLLANKKIFIAGGGMSVGRACIDLFQQHGARVAFLDIHPERVAKTVEATGALGYCVDIADKDAVHKAINEAALAMGGLTALLNIASEMQGGTVAQTRDEHLDRMIDVNIKGFYWSTQAAIPHLLESGNGSIVQFGSVAATHPGYGESYGFAKAAQIALAYQLAMEHAPTIRSNALLCGWISDSPKSRALTQSDALTAAIFEDHPMQRPATAEELAGACMFLVSDLSMAVNGETIVADGGQTRTQGNLNAMFKNLPKLLADDPQLLTRMQKMTQANSPEELLACDEEK